jgi:predicted amidophosphoribosyltransferase
MRRAGPVRAIDGVDWCKALLSYRGAARELVARAKYRNQRAGLRWLAEGMAGLLTREFDAITWAPASPSHVRSRGFDHGELLAGAVAKALGGAAEPLLERRTGASLTGLSAAQRRGGPRLEARRAHRAYPLAGLTVLVVDDVITTGATLATAAATLRSQGAHSVLAVAAAHTPIGRSALPRSLAEDVPCG